MRSRALVVVVLALLSFPASMDGMGNATGSLVLWGGDTPATFRVTVGDDVHYVRVAVEDDGTSNRVTVVSEGWSETVSTIHAAYAYDRMSRARVDDGSLFFWGWVDALDTTIRVVDGEAAMVRTGSAEVAYLMKTGRTEGATWTYDLAGNLQSVEGTLDGLPFEVVRVSTWPSPPVNEASELTSSETVASEASADCYSMRGYTSTDPFVGGIFSSRYEDGCSIGGHHAYVPCTANVQTWASHVSRWRGADYRSEYTTMETFTAEFQLDGYAVATAYDQPEIFGMADVQVVGRVEMELRSGGDVREEQFVIMDSASGGRDVTYAEETGSITTEWKVNAGTTYTFEAAMVTSAYAQCLGAADAYSLWAKGPASTTETSERFTMKLNELSGTTGNVPDCQTIGDAGDWYDDAERLTTPMGDCAGTLTVDDTDYYKFYYPGDVLWFRFLDPEDSICFVISNPGGYSVQYPGSPDYCAPEGWSGLGTYNFDPGMEGWYRLSVRAPEPLTDTVEYSIALDPK